MIQHIRGIAVGAMCCALSALVGYVVGEGQASTDGLAALTARVDEADTTDSKAYGEGQLCPPEPLQECEAGREALRESVSDLTRRQARLREDLEFYRGLVDAGQADDAVRLHQARWVSLGGDRILLRVLMVRGGGASAELPVKLAVKLRGMVSGAVRELRVDRLVVGAVPQLAFELRGFHEWEAEIRLPADFKPDRLIAELTPGKRKRPIVESWLWSEIEK